jgi:hypothetical protein
MIVAPSGAGIAGPSVSWQGRRHGRRQPRRWARAWSPEQIARRLPIDFPDDGTMRISHEAIYQALFIQGRGGLRRELTASTTLSVGNGGRPMPSGRPSSRSMTSATNTAAFGPMRASPCQGQGKPTAAQPGADEPTDLLKTAP